MPVIYTYEIRLGQEDENDYILFDRYCPCDRAFSMMTEAYISLGSNQGERKKNIADALEALEKLPGVRVAAVSGLYETEPQGDADQPWFFNRAAKLSCGPENTPAGLLDNMLAIETSLGRERNSARRFGPRTIDLDLLLFGRKTLESMQLTLPHPRMAERAFVLVPLLEIEPDLHMPDGKSVRELLALLPHRVDGQRIYQS